jgi:hypothetical protein
MIARSSRNAGRSNERRLRTSSASESLPEDDAVDDPFDPAVQPIQAEAERDRHDRFDRHGKAFEADEPSREPVDEATRVLTS